MPESTSSKTRVGTGDPRASTTFSASISRDSSPPERSSPAAPALGGVGGDEEGDAARPTGPPARLGLAAHLPHQPRAVELQRWLLPSHGPSPACRRRPAGLRQLCRAASRRRGSRRRRGSAPVTRSVPGVERREPAPSASPATPGAPPPGTMCLRAAARSANAAPRPPQAAAVGPGLVRQCVPAAVSRIGQRVEAPGPSASSAGLGIGVRAGSARARGRRSGSRWRA
jgi:hypothetical protein